MTNHGICFDLNIFEPDFQINYELGIKTKISTTTTDL